MKKIIIKTGLIFLATFLFYNCNDDSLERYPLDKVSNETFWNSENDLMVYNNRLYDLAKDDNNVPILMGHDVGGNSNRFSIWHLDGFSDNNAPRHRRTVRFQEVRSGKHHVPTNLQYFGYRGWGFVRTVNIGLDNYNKADIAQSIIDKYAGEARLFRGWFYADKVSKFGDVQWVDHELNIDSEELYSERTPREEVMEKVLEDLTFACEKLPDDWGDGNDPGRLNRWCALAVKSRVCLFEGTWRKYHGGSNPDLWLQEAADAAKEIIDNGPYSIYSTGDPYHDYNAYHRTLNLIGNPEIIYYRKYKEGIIVNNIQIYSRNYSGGATKSMVEDYLCTDGLPISLSPLYQGDGQIEDVFVNRDPRLRQTVLHPEDQPYYFYDRSNEYTYPRVRGMSGGRKSETGYHIIKMWNVDDQLGKAFNTGETPAITLRFGEVLLNYAEASAELGTLTQTDLDLSINKLRDRVAMPHMTMDVPIDPRYANDGVSALILEIRRERRVELFYEGFRYDDLRRWKQGKKLEIPDMGMRWDDAAIARYPGATVSTSVDPVSGKTYIDVYKGTDWENPVFDESKHYLWPIPLSVISQNTNISQNPGW